MHRAVVFCLIPLALAAQTVSKDVRVDQAGYLPDSPKAAILAGSEAGAFEIRRVSDNKAAFSAKAGEGRQDELSGERVRVLDFTALQKPGRYYVEVPGVGRSQPFEIGKDVYRRAWYLATRSYYGQRCGVKVDMGKEFPGFKYEECHKIGQWHASSGRTGPRESKAGWHDAGDYGRYTVNSGITTATLLWAYEMFPATTGKLKLDLPESGNKTPDLLDEIRWNLEWMMTMQDTDGGAWHKQTSERFAGFVMPEKDAAPSVVIGSGSAPFKSTCATADFAAVMGIAARVYKPFDPAFAAAAGKAAASAWTWAEANPSIMFRNPQGVATGGYGDGSCADERLWASAELWRTTGEAKYQEAFLTQYQKFLTSINDKNPPAWPSVGAMGLWTYAMGSQAGTNAEAKEAIRRASVQAAEAVAARTFEQPFRVSMLASNYVWGSNSTALNYSLQLLVADRLQPSRKFVDAAVENLHYILGRNPFSVSWVTWVGSDWYKKPHHRPSGADTNAEPWPGLLSGGPNRSKQDPGMRKLPDGLPPMKMWVDDQESYASNEVAINWNAPLVFVLSGLLR